jgi:hypothetical protein
MICIDQKTGKLHPNHEPLKTLAQIRRQPGGAIEFGLHANHIKILSGRKSTNGTFAISPGSVVKVLANKTV